ncbi:flavin-containing monooxygenase [Aspergillus stella-maris]|uniref:flavin-containing monooxygenase n=1 Tax=Aspergillus stella-maris TaxID=1810926 RepID=UPI003CCCA7DD
MLPSAYVEAPDLTPPTPQTKDAYGSFDRKLPAVGIQSLQEEDHNPQSLPRTIYPPLILEDHPVDERLLIKAIVVGAGITGITAGVLLPAKGGTWHSNTYPGVKCDVPSHVYQSTFSPNKSWTENYSRGAEIKAYWKGVATKYSVWQYLQLNSEILSARWSDEKAKWAVHIKQTDPETGESNTITDEAEFLITGTGRFSSPRLPDIPGINDYKGKVIHTGAWDKAFDPTGKNLALIGNGASGLQILPELQKVATRVDHYTRNPTWVAGTLGGEKLSRTVPIAEDLKGTWKSNNASYHVYRKELESAAWTRFAIVEKGGATNAAARAEFEQLMGIRLGGKKNELLPLVLPGFAPNCRRLTPGPGYLEAVAQENVKYIRTPIKRFTETGLKTVDGRERIVDAVICATGADHAGGDPGFPDTYLGMTTADYPNLIFIGGPNAGSGFAGTVPHAVETQVTYAAKILRKVSSQRIRTITPSKAAVLDFRAYCESFFPTTVLSEGCSSWYNNQVKGGRIVAVWPGSGAHVNYVRRDVRWEDFEYTYHNLQGNRFGYLGNGWTTRDVAAKEGRSDEVDFTEYLKEEAGDGIGVDLRGYHEAWWEV